MSKTYSAGIVTAYGAAKRAGYQGTYEDFCRQQAGYAENAAAVEAAKTAAQTAANTATTKATEATTAATAAQTAKTQTEQAASQALTDISSARSGAISAVQTEGATQTANATAQAQAAATSATTASTKASEASASATTATTKATEAAASATSAANAASAAQGVLESIPEDYSDLSEDVDKLKADLNDRVDFTDSYVMTLKPVTLPESVRGNFNYKKNADGDLMISGTNNVAQLLNIKAGTYDINGVTIIVNGNTVSVSGQPTADFNFHFETGTKKTATELTAMTLGLPEHIYTLSQKVTNGTVFPPIFIRSKVSGNVSVAQNNTNVFTMDKTTCGGFYMLLQSNKNYSCSFDIALLPYSATNGNKYRTETSHVFVYDSDGIYQLDGYTWVIGQPTVAYIESLLPKKPKCKYSLRTIDYSSMTECLDVYIPASNGYVNYIFGHTESAISGGNVWRLVQVDAVNDALVYRFHITQLGETEMAIMISGRDDFIGGTTHGDEVMDADSLLFVVDGKPTDITTLTELTDFETLQCFLVSDLYDPADHTTLVGKHGREWKFDKNGLYIGQTVEFLSDSTLGNSYMPMLCVLRGNDTASALQVTDTYTDDGNYQQYDVSTGGFNTYPNVLKTDVRKINLFGKVSRVRASLQIIEQPEGLNKEGTFLYNGINTYNKIYCCLCGYGGGKNTQNVSNGEKWKVKSQITFDVG